MAHRALIAAIGVVLAAGLMGCGRKKKPAQQAEGGKSASVAWEQGKGAVSTGEGRTELQKLAVKYRQLRKLTQRKPMPYKPVESLGWDICRRSRNLVDSYENTRREKVTAEAREAELKAKERPEDKWLKWPEAIRDLDRVSINAKSVALAAGTWDDDKLRQKLKDLDKVAVRCLPGLAAQEVSPVQPAVDAAGSGKK